MGQARAIVASLQPADDGTLWDWNKPLLAALGIGRGHVIARVTASLRRPVQAVAR